MYSNKNMKIIIFFKGKIVIMFFGFEQKKFKLKYHLNLSKYMKTKQSLDFRL